MSKLVDELKKESSQFRKDHRTGMPGGSKKYRWLYNFVTRETKKESGQDQDDDPDQLDQ